MLEESGYSGVKLSVEMDTNDLLLFLFLWCLWDIGIDLKSQPTVYMYND